MWRFGFFDAVETVPGIYDRVYNAEEFSVPFSALIDTGVLEGAGDSLEVTTDGSSMQTTIGTGIAFIRGRYAENTSPRAHTHDTETVGVDRIDRIVIRLDLRPEARYVESFVKKGVASTNPAPPALQRDENVYEISLAQVYIRGGQSFIDPADITDERGDEEICPWARSKVLPHIDAQAVIDLRNDFETHEDKIASQIELGHVKVGRNLTVDADGTINVESVGKKPARFIIGTSTAGWTEDEVDYLCDGVNDQVEINNAIQALPASGGEIVILDGTYNIASKINVNKHNVTIRGNGNSTVLKRAWNSASSEGVITLANVTQCRIERLYIDSVDPFYVYNLCIYVDAGSNNCIEGIVCVSGSNGIYVKSSYGNKIGNNMCFGQFESGIYLDGGGRNNVTGNICMDITDGAGIRLNNSVDNVISSNTLCFNLTGIIILGSLINANNTVVGNTITRNSGSGINVTYDYTNCNDVLIGNNISINSRGIHVTYTNQISIIGNVCNNNEVGIEIYETDRSIITGNICIRGTGQPSDYSTSQYTIKLTGGGCDYNLISSNNIMGKNVVIDGGTGNTNVNNKYN